MRILFVGMVDNIHTARWLNQLNGQGWDLHLFPVEVTTLHPAMQNVTVHDALSLNHPKRNRDVRLDDLWPLMKNGWPLPRGARLGRSLLKHLSAQANEPAWRLARTIRKVNPDIIHSLEIIKAGYLVNQARKLSDNKQPPWIATNWGSDIYLYGRLAAGVNIINDVLAGCDYYTCECQRDVALARGYGFQGEPLLVLPNAGGFDVSAVQQLKQAGRTSERRSIALKGYQGWAGRALVGLRAIELCADILRDYRVEIYLANTAVEMAAEIMAYETGLKIEIVPQLSHQEMLRLHGRARVSIGLSISDAISTSLLETIIMGSFPIQSNTSCADEWLRDGATGMIVPPNDPEPIAAAIRRAVSDDALVDRAADENMQLALKRLDQSVIQPQVIAMYRKIMAARN